MGTESRYKEWIRERKRELDTLLDFCNLKIPPLDDREMATTVYNARLFEGEASWQPFIFGTASGDFSLDPQDLARKKEEILELQRHFKEKLEKILRAAETGQMTTITEIAGPMAFTAHPLKDRFLLNLKEDDSRKVDSLAKEKARLDLRFVDLVKVLGLTPGRFRKCLRRECGRIFYQSSFKKRVYCSTKCSGAQRQSRFQLAHRDLKKENVIVTGEGVVEELQNEKSSMEGIQKTRVSGTI
jgi:hypothetical protein